MFIIGIIKAVVLVTLVFSAVPVLIWWERKGAAYIQDRRGPNRANVLGIRLGGFVHNLADALKLFFKEDIIPTKADKPIYVMAPMISLIVVLLIGAVIPFSAPIKFGDFVLTTQLADLNAGFIYVLAVSSFGVYGILLAGWASGSAYSLFGGLRASAQMISYEVAMGLALVGLVVYTGTVRLDEIVSLQGANVLDWNFVRQPAAFVIFLVCLFAEANRNPFDLPEGESELVAGYHTEYSSMKFAMFFMAEYAHIFVGSLFLASLFFGGWQIPFLSTKALHENFPTVLKIAVLAVSLPAAGLGIYLVSRVKKARLGDLRDFEPAVFGLPMVIAGATAIVLVSAGFLRYIPPEICGVLAGFMQAGALILKALVFSWLFIWVRWTLPRFRYDQLMRLGWNVLVPLALLNIAATAVIVCWL